ncbi:MAG TPA: hypothetical protein VEC99_08055, partial [Clostridia bacterium]|nr:hypothetical protein [Clostridia bacterium]
MSKVGAGQADVVWVFGPDGTGFWETAMAGQGAFWVNGGAYPEVNCPRKFVLFGFGWASHQGVGFMLENTAHMSEVIMHDHIAYGWPASHRITGWYTLDLNNPSRVPMTYNLNDWNYFTVSDSVHWNTKLVAPRHSQAGLSHFPPTACVNYGWSPVRIDFNVHWDLDAFQTYGGAWGIQDGNYSVSAGTDGKSILYGSHDLRDNLGEYRVPVILTDADIETGVTIPSGAAGARAGLLLRCSQYGFGVNNAKGYFVGFNPAQGCLELARVDSSYTVIERYNTAIILRKFQNLSVSLRESTLRVSLPGVADSVIVYTNLIELDGAVGFCTYGTEAAFSHLHVTPVIQNFAENWRTYPNLGNTKRILTPLEWSGDGQPYSDMDYWYAWWYEHLPKNPGTHEVRNTGTGELLGRVLNSWWPYIFDINVFDSPFLPDRNIISAPADTVPPAAPDNLRGIGLSTNSIQIQWNVPEDNIGVTRYEVYRDGQFLRGTPLRYFIDTGLAKNSQHTYSVKARDGSGNTSSMSSTLTVATLSSVAVLQNPGFEYGLEMPYPWRPDAFKGSAVFTWETNGVGRNGGRCISINAGTDLNDARWLQDISGLVPNGRYLLSGWIKGQGIVLDQGATVGANLCAMGTWNHTSTPLSGTFDWTRVEVEVFANSEGKLTVGCRLGFWGNLVGGKVCFDDIALEYVPPFVVPAEAWGANLANLNALPAGLTNAVAIAAGNTHDLALKADGTVIGWGSNSDGQLNFPPLTNVIGIAAGGAHSLAVKADGSLIGWGSNIYGESEVPSGLTNVVAAAAGSRFSAALRADGTVVAWGGNDWGETNVPPGLTNVVAIDAGHEFALALKEDGTVVAWGSFMGTDDNSYPADVPPGLSNVVAVACGTSHAVALDCNGAVTAWGDSYAGQTNVPPNL